VLVSNGDGETAAFALWNLEERGMMFVGGGEKTYEGMIIGENARWDDLDVNPMKAKQLNNVRASRQGRGRPPDPAAPPVAGTGHRLHRGRRTGRGDAQERSACARSRPESLASASAV
jgi:hypothetical protein